MRKYSSATAIPTLIPRPIHQLCKAAAALRGEGLLEWLARTLDATARAELSEHASADERIGENTHVK